MKKIMKKRIMQKKIFNKKIVYSMLAALAAASLLTGCGSSKYSEDNYYSNSIGVSSDSYAGGSYNDYYSAEEFYDGYEVADGSFGTSAIDIDDGAASSSKPANTARKLIKTVDMDVETLEYDNLLASIQDQVNVCGGYIESSYTNNGSKYGHSANYTYYRNGSMTVRIPSDKLDEFLGSFTSLCNVLNKSESVEDVTLSYVDLETHKKALQTEEERLLELMESADNLDDMLTIEARLTDVRYQLESMESQLRTYDNKINYSTVYIGIKEVKEITPEPEPEPETAWERISAGFADSINGLGHGLGEIGIWFIIKLPYLLLWAAIIVAHVFVIRAIVRFNIKKNRMRAEAKSDALEQRVANALTVETNSSQARNIQNMPAQNEQVIQSDQMNESQPENK